MTSDSWQKSEGKGVAPRKQKSEGRPAKRQKSEGPKRHSRDDALPPDVWEQYVRAAETPVERLYVRLCGVWGLRAGEAAHTTLEWISSQAGTLTVPRRCRCSSCRAKGSSWKSKRDASNRTLPIRNDAGTWGAVKEVFGRGPRAPVSERRVYEVVVRVADRAGLMDRAIYPHALRATAANRFARLGLNELELCQVMGWEDLRSARPYLKASGSAAAKALEGVDLGI